MIPTLGRKPSASITGATFPFGHVIGHFKNKRGDRSAQPDRKSTRLNSSHVAISYAVFCLKKKIKHSPLTWGEKNSQFLKKYSINTYSMYSRYQLLPRYIAS